MRRIILLGAALIAGSTVLVAQSDPVAERNALMKQNGRQLFGVINRMAKGQIPFEQAKAEEAFAILETIPAKALAAYKAHPGGVAAGSKYHASPKVWENMSDFEAKFAALSKAIGENKGKTKSVEELAVAVKAIGATCESCHDTYQVE